MTRSEKRQRISDYCKDRNCFNCKLHNINPKCFENIDKNYEIIFGNEEITPIEENAPTEDPVNRPSHYTDGKIEVIDYIEDKKLGFCLGNAIKYISRAGKKDPDKEIEDLNKAKWYIERRIKEIQEAK